MKMHEERTCVVPENIHTPPREIIGNSEGEGGGRGSWESIFQRVMDHVQNIESNVPLI